MLFALVGMSLVLMALGYYAGKHWSGREGLSLPKRLILMIVCPTSGFGAGLDRMVKMFPRSHSDHPDEKYPRHEDHWPPH